MTEAWIPVDLFNPGQVFACLGFLELADVVLGETEGGFDLSDEAKPRFVIHAGAESNPFAAVLEFLAKATLQRRAPIGYVDPPSKKGTAKGDGVDEDNECVDGKSLELAETFPARKADPPALPIRIRSVNGTTMDIGHWADGSGCETFKLYSGNRSAYGIASAMLLGTREKPRKNQTVGDLKTKGIAQLWEDRAEAMIEHPFDVLTPMGGSFNFDPRGAWTALDAGYSPNDQKHQVAASPVVEFVAACGLENTRPDEYEARKVRYSTWGVPLPLALARVALFFGIPTVPQKRFRFELALAGKNKVVNFAKEEIPS